jgi:hypothetical protein
MHAGSGRDSVCVCSEAMRYAPHMSALYSNRAAALLHRQWRGDSAQALADACHALLLEYVPRPDCPRHSR